MVASMLTVVATAQAFAAETETAQTGAVTSADSFTWDNATVYFVLTDRFVNGDTSNDHSYNRLIDRDGSVVTADKLNSTATTFHGGDFKGLTSKIKDGYFDDLGVNALWITAPYEQIHGYVIVGEGKKDSVKHYAYHGYYAMDYTQTDANFGTAAEFKEMVDTAHEHGIRIVLDIVMNHPGYNTIYDMYEYNFGAFVSGYGDNYALDQYYNWKSNANYHRSIDYNSSAAASGWANWWGGNWLRAGITGYTPLGGDALTGTAGGDLPDFKTESTATVSVPTFLQNKWKTEGRYNDEMNGLNNWFSKTGNQKTVRNHLVYWLSEWVREYGVDGFRCDTAKHVELASWKALSDECTKALNEWRAANKGKVEAANWTDEFWMTAEDYGAGVNKDGYFTQGGFDSKINFSFTGGGGVPNSGSINNTYNDYANKINNDSSFNMLSYISSHDTALCRNDLIYQGSAFLLLPGAVQIFYGDETARPYLNDPLGDKIKDHQLRSDMNWNSINQSVLSHWQKVGQFRKNHVAIGAGTHKAITATSGQAFVREYNKNGVSDTVFAVIAASQNTNVTLTVGSYVSDGTLLKNTYDNTTATVSGGKVTFNSGANGTILVEIAGASTKPDVSVSQTGGNFADTLTITATLNEYATSGTYQIGSAAPVTFTGTKSFTIGADMAFDESVTVKFTATDGTDVKERSYTYTKIDPDATPFKFPTERTVYLLDTAGWGKANCYAWITGGSNNGTWPGVAMTDAGEFEGSKVYSYEVPDGMANVIFNDGTNQTDDLTFQQYSYYNNGTKQWTKVDPPKPTETQKPSETKPTEIQPTETQPETKPGITAILGDVDGDGDVSILDATCIQLFLAKEITFNDKEALAADADCDGDISIIDVTEIQMFIAQIPVDHPIGEVVGGSVVVDPTQPEPTEKETEAPKPTNPPTPTEKETEAPTQPPVTSTYTLYVDMGSQGTANAYYWTDKGDAPLTWPGVAMQHVSGGVYSIEVDSAHNMIIFNGGFGQTDDLTIPGDGYIYRVSSGQWELYNPGPLPTVNTDGSYIYYKNNSNWGQVYIYYWSDANTTMTTWPGVPMESIGNNIYRAAVPSDATYVIFNNSAGDQTEDITIQGFNQIYDNGWSAYNG